MIINSGINSFQSHSISRVEKFEFRVQTSNGKVVKVLSINGHNQWDSSYISYNTCTAINYIKRK